MTSKTVRWRALRFDLGAGIGRRAKVEVASEELYDLYVNERLYVTAVLTPSQLEEWSIGFLYSEGLINSAAEVKEVSIEGKSIEVEIPGDLGRRSKFGRFLPGSCGSAVMKERISYVREMSKELLSRDLRVPKEVIKRITASLNEVSRTYRVTGGTHSAAIFSGEGELLTHSEDVGRHNAVDKVIGTSLMRGTRLDDKIMAVSGRISGDLVFKCSRARIQMVLSPSAPLSMGLELAEIGGITLIGFARGDRFNVYTHPHRLT